jgi:hypothetical protein
LRGLSLPLGIKLGKFGLKPKQSKGKYLYTHNFITKQIWLETAKLAIFLAHVVLFVAITSATPNPVANVTNEYLQNAFRLIWANSLIVGILGIVITIWWFVDLFITGSAVRKQNLEKILKAVDEQA